MMYSALLALLTCPVDPLSLSEEIIVCSKSYHARHLDEFIARECTCRTVVTVNQQPDLT